MTVQVVQAGPHGAAAGPFIPAPSWISPFAGEERLRRKIPAIPGRSDRFF